MVEGKKPVVVMPAYTAEKTLRQTFGELPHEYVDDVILVDDASGDNTVEVARTLRINILVHTENRGYGANQKTCYKEALGLGADIVVMIHPDDQYSPKLVTAVRQDISRMLPPSIFPEVSHMNSGSCPRP
jgi:glycosyltransferase involved in cell wall biosynthesis